MSSDAAGLTSLPPAISKRILELFEDIKVAKQELGRFEGEMRPYYDCLLQNHVNKLERKCRLFATHEQKLRSQLIPEIQTRKPRVSVFQDVIRQHEDSEFTLTLVRRDIASIRQSVQEKIDFVKPLKSCGANYVGRGGSFDDVIAKHYLGDTLCAFYIKDVQTLDRKILASNRRLFIELCKSTSPKYECYIVDCDFHPLCWPGEPRIKLFKQGLVVEKNVGRALELNLAQSKTAMKPVDSKSDRRGPLATRCPGRNCSRDSIYTWKCGYCKEFVEYGFDDNLSCYCKCGVMSALQYEFKCSDPAHRYVYETPDQDDLKEQLDELRPPELNILILGETGVGKSTWINAFYNFHYFEKLDDARKPGKCLSLIPSKFVVCDSNFKQIEVSTGTSDNECQEAGQSSTQDPKVYSFNIDGIAIRLIDTPGIGDVRGLKQDKENFEKILAVMSKYDKIHAICILLKPNHSKLNVSFTFCTMELLTRLHRDACQNIVFCFTNSRGTFYKPGDTVEPLTELLKQFNIDIELKKQTMYCFDSESYRFLAALCNRDPVEFSDKDAKDFEQSWEQSYDETARLMKHLLTLAPHNTEQTLLVNNVRRAIQMLSAPMADRSQAISRMEAIIKREKDELATGTTSKQDLEQRRMTKRTTVEKTKLKDPQTVCKNCSTVVDGEPVYNHVCHENCRENLGQIFENVAGHHSLMGCQVFGSGSGAQCSKCGHYYQSHMYIYYKVEVVHLDVEDKAVVEALKRNLDFEQTKKLIMKEKEDEIAKLNREMAAIQNAPVTFANFLKRSAIVFYNEALLQYLDHLIKEEERTQKEGVAASAVEELKQLKEQYVQEKNILHSEKDGVHGGDDKVLTAVEVEEEITRLRNKLQIENIKDVMTVDSANFEEQLIGDKSTKTGFWEMFRNHFYDLH